MFTIFGATGNTGSIVASELLARGKKVRVLVRNADKARALAERGAEVAIGDVTDAASVERALAGAEGAYMLMPPDNQSTDLLARGKRIADAYAAGLTKHAVPHVVLLSSVGAQHASGTGPVVTAHNAEVALAQVKGTTTTFVRAAYFMENILAYAQAMKGDGVLPVFGGGESYPFPMVATKDIGRVAADALTTRPNASEIIELSGPKEYSFVDAAAEASTILGRKVTATALPLDGLVPAFTSFGFSMNVASLYREMIEGMGSGLMRYDGQGRAVRGKVTLGEVLSALR